MERNLTTSDMDLLMLCSPIDPLEIIYDCQFQVVCMDPSSSDPESWSCECVEMIIAACGSPDDEECMFNTMCANAEDCSEWKTANNCPTALEQHAAGMSARTANISLLGTGLDNTLSGKCAE